MSGKSEYEGPGPDNYEAQIEKKALMEVIDEIRELVYDGLNDLDREYLYHEYSCPGDTLYGIRLSTKREAYWYVLDRLHLLSPEWDA